MSSVKLLDIILEQDRVLCLKTDIKYLRDLIRINRFSPSFRNTLNGILDTITRKNGRISPRQFELLQKNVYPGIERRPCSQMFEVVKPADPSKVDSKELEKGIEVEMEHTDSKKEAEKIALQHLAEDPKYYTKLKSLNLEQVQFTKPDFEFEWEEANRYPEFQELGKDGWVSIAKKGHTVRFSKIKDVLGNVDLNFDALEKAKKIRFNNSFKRGKVEIPVAVKFSDKDYDLIAGNTRLSGLVSKGIDPKIWIVDLSSIEENVHKPMNPGILKKRLGKLSCSKVRAERAKLKDKGTTYAKALQRYLNYHCG